MNLRGRKEAEILARTFRDRLTVKRFRWQTNPETQESEQVEEVVYDGIRCALSQSSNNKPERQTNYSTAERESVLFTETGIMLEDNDIAIVTTEAGPVYQGKTGRTFMYISHGETPFAAERLA